MPLLNVSEYAPYVHRLVVGQLKPIAYGISPVVNLVYPLQPAYFVSGEEVEELPESAKSFWRQKPLETLAEEDPRTTVIIVCSGREEDAWKAVSAYGDFPVIRFFSYEFLSPYLPALTGLPKTYQRRTKKVSARRALVVRGAIGNDNNLLAVQKIAHDHPEDLVIVSTWDDTPPELLERAGSFCDQLLTSAKPAYGGSQNRNFQITLAQKGMAAALASNVEKCLICRTDTLFTKPATPEKFDWLMERFPLMPEVQRRQKGRLIVPDLYTRRYLPYHASDVFTYGWTVDVAAFWSASTFDNRPVDSPEYLPCGYDTTLDACVRNKAVVETYFWLNYMEKIGRRPLYTVDDWMDFQKDYLLVADMHAERILWTSKDFRDHAVLAGRYKTCMSFSDWAELSFAPRSFARIDLTKIPWLDFVNSP
jgi:hypothetical protein